MSKLSNKENLLKALRGEQVDRVPWVPFVGVHAGKLLNVDAQTLLKNADLMAKGVIEASKIYKADGMPICFDLQLEAEMLGCKLKWAEKTPPSVISHPLADELSIEDLPDFDPYTGRLATILDATSKIKSEIGDDVALYGLITGPFTLALHLRGSEIFLDIADEEECVDELMTYCTQVQLKTAKAYIDAGVDVIALVDPMCSQISPTCFNDYVSKYVNEIFDYIKSRGKLSSMFICGNATSILDELCKCTCDNISIDENVDLNLLKEKALKSGKSFGGNIKLTTVILLGDKIDCKKNALECIDIGGKNSFILSPGCDLAYDSPIENVVAISDIATDEYTRDITRAISKNSNEDKYDDIEFPDYENERVIDVITLDSLACPPCFYMLQAAKQAVLDIDEDIKVVERKITTREGLAFMSKLNVKHIPSICIDSKVAFSSIIPDKNTIIKAIKK